MFKVKTSELKNTCSLLYSAHKPIMFFGTYGIGKSEMMLQWAMTEAAKQSRIFLDWNRTSSEVQNDSLRNPEKYFVYIDIRLSQLDAGDLRGLPNFASTKEYLDLIALKWVNYITKEKASGVVFFDEINLASPMIMQSAYAIINDRVISDRSISKNVFIVAAGNTIEDTDMVQPLPKPLLDRFAVAELVLDKDYWLDEYADKYVNPHITAFCRWKKDMIFQKAKSDAVKDITPRGISNASKLLDKVDFKDSNAVYTALSLFVGEVFTSEFRAYYNYFKTLDWDDLKDNPEQIEDTDLDHMWAIMGGAISEIKAVSEREDVKNMGDIYKGIIDYINILCYMPSDMIIAALKQFKSVVPYFKIKENPEYKGDLFALITVFLMTGTISEKLAPTIKGKCDKVYKLFKERHGKQFQIFAQNLSQR